MARFITGNALLKVLQQRGLVNQDTRSVVIDITAGHLPTLTIHHYMATELTMVLTDQLNVTDTPEYPKITTPECQCGHTQQAHIERGYGCLGVCGCPQFQAVTTETKENSDDESS